MEQQARVTPKNIQFVENIHVREIPSNEIQLLETSREESWDPNFNESEIFRTPQESPIAQQTCIIICVVVGLIFVVIIIGIVLAVVLTQKSTTAADNSLSYNQACTPGSNQCISSKSLYCPGGFCLCYSPYSWNTAADTCTLLTYGQSCSMSNQCNSSLGLNCTNQICQCDGYHSWNSLNNSCVIILNNTLNYGDKCLVGLSQCNSSVDLTCTGNCTCETTKIWNVSSCVCPSGTFLNSSNFCEAYYLNNRSCVIGLNQCDSTRGLSCSNNSRCECDSTKYWNFNFQQCYLRLNYSNACSLDSDCIPTLVCPTTANTCVCPQSLADYVCNCENTKYYDSALLQCVDRSSINGSCIASTNYTCASTLYCNAGTCNCPTGTSWNPSNSTCV